MSAIEVCNNSCSCCFRRRQLQQLLQEASFEYFINDGDLVIREVEAWKVFGQIVRLFKFSTEDIFPEVSDESSDERGCCS